MRHLRPTFGLKTCLRYPKSEKMNIKDPWVKASLEAPRVGKQVENLL